jgi:predicted esterase
MYHGDRPIVRWGENSKPVFARLTAVRRFSTIVPLLLALGSMTGCGDAVTGTFGLLSAENSAGRTGAYYLPPDYETGSNAVVLLYHGTNGNGAYMIRQFAPVALANDLILIAPDSRVAPTGEFSWEVGTAPGSQTEDYQHAIACLEEVLAIPDVRATPGRMLAAGHSGGASSAPYVATNDRRFNAFAVLHGGVLPENLGPNVIPGWFATGEMDELRTPDHVEAQADSVRDLGFEDVTFTVYPGGHQVSATERAQLIAWWLAL